MLKMSFVFMCVYVLQSLLCTVATVAQFVRLLLLKLNRQCSNILVWHYGKNGKQHPTPN